MPNEQTTADLAKLGRWHNAAHKSGWCVPGLCGVGEIVDCCDDGTPWVAVVQGTDPEAEPRYHVARADSWRVIDAITGASCGEFASLGAALGYIWQPPKRRRVATDPAQQAQRLQAIRERRADVARAVRNLHGE